MLKYFFIASIKCTVNRFHALHVTFTTEEIIEIFLLMQKRNISRKHAPCNSL